MYCTCSSSSSVVSSGVVNTGNSNFDGIAVATTLNIDSKELKISVVVSGAKTQSIFDDVFSKIVADSQPIPGFRRVKGGKFFTLFVSYCLKVLGQSRIYRQAISKIINYAIAGFVEKKLFWGKTIVSIFGKNHFPENGLMSKRMRDKFWSHVDQRIRTISTMYETVFRENGFIKKNSVKEYPRKTSLH
ncbi:hypothetical protein QQ045_006489 [Rhodiola kirilowii]